MNVMDVSSLLRELDVEKVRYGQHVLQRANSSLPLALHFPDNISGDGIADHFDRLPTEHQDSLLITNVLSEEQADEMLSDIVSIRRAETIRLNEIEDALHRFGVIIAFLLLAGGVTVMGGYAAFVYWSGDTMGGVLYSTFKEIAIAIWETITDG